MTTLYVASTETFVGKSAVCMGLLSRMARDGFTVGYMKPVSVSVMHTPDSVLDEDAALIRETLGLTEPLDQIAPVLLTPSVTDAILRGQPPDFTAKLQSAYPLIARGKDAMILEGTNNWAEGALIDLTPGQVIDLLGASGLLVIRYRTMRAVDAILTVHRYFGNRLLGVLLNQVEDPQLEFVRSRVEPFLEARNIPVFGVLPNDRLLASVTVSELLEHLGGQYIGRPEWNDKLIETLMIGAMGTDAGLSFFRRHANKAVVTGGDRIDLQLVAMETSTNALILTGNIRPSLRVVDRAEEREVPIIIVPDDTLTTVERAAQLFGRIRFRQRVKLQRFIEMMDNNFNYERLYDSLGLTRY